MVIVVSAETLHELFHPRKIGHRFPIRGGLDFSDQVFRLASPNVKTHVRMRLCRGLGDSVGMTASIGSLPKPPQSILGSFLVQRDGYQLIMVREGSPVSWFRPLQPGVGQRPTSRRRGSNSRFQKAQQLAPHLLPAACLPACLFGMSIVVDTGCLKKRLHSQGRCQQPIFASPGDLDQQLQQLPRNARQVLQGLVETSAGPERGLIMGVARQQAFNEINVIVAIGQLGNQQLYRPLVLACLGQRRPRVPQQPLPTVLFRRPANGPASLFHLPSCGSAGAAGLPSQPERCRPAAPPKARYRRATDRQQTCPSPTQRTAPSTWLRGQRAPSPYREPAPARPPSHTPTTDHPVRRARSSEPIFRT